MPGLSGSHSVIVIGAGFGGICAAIRLKQAGIDDFVVLDRAAGPGGVWHQNRYPGAACDVPISLYSYSFVEDFGWKGTHGSWSEMTDYIEFCIDRFGVRENIEYNVEVAGATWDEANRRWEVDTSRGKMAADFVISACGLFNEPNLPAIAGVETFTGPQLHTARWDAEFDATGRTVAVIGTGCSSAQLVPQIVGQVSNLILFQRSACHVMPKHERVFSDDERELYRRFPLLRSLERAGFERGSAAFIAFQFDADVRARVNETLVSGMALQVADDAKRAQLLPTFEVGGKRPISSSEFLPALDRENVAIVSEAITRIIPKGIVTADGRVHEVDAIIFGTGFRVSEYLAHLEITGEAGQSLHERWRNGAYAYYGMLLDGFPNFFMVYGPNSNAVGSILQMIEPQVQFIVGQIALARSLDALVTVDADTVNQFNEQLQDGLAKSVYGLKAANNYFSAASGKIVTQWPGSTAQFETAIRALDRQSLLTLERTSDAVA